MKLSRLFPVSLAARTVLLVIAVVAIAEYATFSLIQRHERSAHLTRTAQFIASQVRLMQAVLPELDSDARKRLPEAGFEILGLKLLPDGTDVPGHTPERGFAPQLAANISQLLDAPVSLRNTGPKHRSDLWIGFMAGGEQWWLVLPPPRFEPKGLPPDLWFWLTISLTILMLIAGLFVRGIVKPLARLGHAVAATGNGRAHTVTPEGPREVRRLAERHNTMVSQLAHADAERREMLAGLTHDLRAPLARLRVRLALLENDTERHGLERDTEDMERIVAQCLAFLRSEENGAQSLDPLPIADAVSNEVARHRELGRPVEMTVQEAAAACLVAIDHGSLQRLLDNLIDNALQYGAPPVEVSLTVMRPGIVTLHVRDHGQGIAPEQRAHALEAFAQIEPARATRGSCGLGLAIVRRIVEACGGETTLSDASGGGLEVAMSFPATSDHAETPNSLYKPKK